QTINVMNESLEEKVIDRTRKLEIANRKLKDYLEDLRMFTHVTSHDLKELLRNISGFSSLIERRIGDQIKDGDTTTFLQMIRSNAHQMHRLIEGIQFYTKIDSNTDEEELLMDVSLMDVIEQIKETLAITIAESQAQIIITDPLPSIYTSASVIQVILKNLIENGIKYNRSKNPLVEVVYQEKEAEHWILVKDNGIGIDPAYQDQVFDMFSRLHTQEEYIGTGMGLAISLRLAQRLNRTIQLDSKEGEGSTFMLKLPKK
ncbi:MAG: ATP-binding protein, partial [Bacteroidota bacterium]